MYWPRLGAVLHTTGLWDRSYLGVGRRCCQQKLTERAVLAGSPPDRGRAWWEPWARIQAGVSRQRENSPARTQGTLCLPKTPGGPDPFDGSERGQKRCLNRQEFQLNWVQRHKGAPLKSSQDDREVPRGHKGWPGGIHPPGTLQEPHDEIMLSQGPAVHCIVVSRDSGHIHFQGGGWQPTLSCRKESTTPIVHLWGVFSARRTPVSEQTPLKITREPDGTLREE